VKKSYNKRALLFNSKDHLSIFIFIMVLFLMGIIFGAIIVNSLSLPQKEDLFYYLSQFFGELKQGKVSASSEMFVYSFKENAKFIILMWILGISIIGLPLILILLFIKGIVIGFTVGFLVSQTGWQGFMLACVSVLPQNIILVPVTIIMASCAVIISIKMIKRQFLKSSREKLRPYFIQYSMLLGMALLSFIVAALIEAFLSPGLMKAVIDHIG
jgi:stage II sporulation protein M